MYGPPSLQDPYDFANKSQHSPMMRNGGGPSARQLANMSVDEIVAMAQRKQANAMMNAVPSQGDIGA